MALYRPRLYGKTGIQTIFDAALEDNPERVIRTALVGPPLIEFAGEEFARTYPARRIAAGIRVESLRMVRPKSPSAPEEMKEVRVCPADVRLRESMVLWSDYAAHVDPDTLEIQLLWGRDSWSSREWYRQIWERATLID